MEVLHDRVAGLDVHKEMVAACVRTPGQGRARRSETREFATFLGDLERMRDWLVAEGVTHVAWKRLGSIGGRCGSSSKRSTGFISIW
jgi:transposase